jgi:hypothetical protein
MMSNPASRARRALAANASIVSPIACESIAAGTG